MSCKHKFMKQQIKYTENGKMSSESRTKNRKIWRFGLHLLFSLILFTAMLWLTLPLWLSSVLETELAKQGFTAPDIAVQEVGLSQAVLGPIILHGSRNDLIVRKVEIRFDLLKLLQGKINSVLFEGIVAWAHITQKGLQFEAIPPDLMRKETDGTAVKFGSLLLRDVQLFIRTGSNIAALELNAEIHHRGQNGSELYNGNLRAGFPQMAKAQLYPTQTQSAVSSDTDNAQLQTQPDNTESSLPGTQLSAQFSYLEKVLNFSGNALILPAGWLEKAGISTTTSSLELHFNGQIDTGAKPSSYNCTFTLPEQNAKLELVKSYAEFNAQVQGSARIAGTLESLKSFSTELNLSEVNFHTETLGADAKNFHLDAEIAPVAFPSNAKTGWIEALPEQLSVTGQLDLHDLELRNVPEADIGAISATMPFVWQYPDGFSKSGKGQITSASIKWHNLESQELAGNTAWGDRRLDVIASGRVPAWHNEVQVQLTLDWNDGLVFELKLMTNNAEVKEIDSWYKELTSLENLQLQGNFNLQLNLIFDNNLWQSSCTFEALEVDLAILEQNVSCKGISGKLILADLYKMRSAPHQELQFDVLQLPGTELHDGRIHYRMEGASNYFIEKAEAGWCKGHLRLYAAVLEFPDTVVDFTLHADRLSIACIVSLIKGVKGTGSGSLYGKVPLGWKNNQFSYGNGYLYTLPGETGILKLEELGVLGEQLSRTLGKGTQLEMVKNALRNFRFDLFRLDFNPPEQEEQPRLRLQLRGESPEQDVERPIYLTVNIHGPLEEIINLSLRIGGF